MGIEDRILVSCLVCVSAGLALRVVLSAGAADRLNLVRRVEDGAAVSSGMSAWVDAQIRRLLPRHHDLAAELPFAIELLSLAVASGAGLIQAISLVGSSDTGEVFRAFDLASRDFSAGLTRSQVLERLGERLGVPAASSLVSAISRADHTGAPLAEVLSVQAEHARKQAYLRRTKAMELIPLWIVLCTVVFLLPSVILVAIVPHLFAFLHTQW